jgi:hypothetical protein
MTTQGSRRKQIEQEMKERPNETGQEPVEKKNQDLEKGLKPEPLPGQIEGVEKEYEKEKKEAAETQPSQVGNVNRSERPGDAVPGDDEQVPGRSGRNREGVE